jgi:hypothetical protein
MFLDLLFSTLDEGARNPPARNDALLIIRTIEAE